jgi:hypothetical protein
MEQQEAIMGQEEAIMGQEEAIMGQQEEQQEAINHKKKKKNALEKVFKFYLQRLPGGGNGPLVFHRIYLII